MRFPKTVRGRIVLTALALWGLLKVSFFFLPLPRYLMRAVWEEAKILWRRTPIERVLAERTLPPNELAKLALVLDARTFATDSVGLPAGKAFTQISRVHRDTLVLLLSAARRDTLALHHWWFPIVGRVPYKGYFDFQDARRDSSDFERRGYDTDLRPAAAFSTLGWFDDPLLTTALRQDSISLVNTVLHELTHNRLFVKGHVEFNETFASFVGSRGAAAYSRMRGDSAALRTIDQRWEEEKTRFVYLSRLLASLDSAYAAHPGDSLARVHARDTVYARAIDALADSLTRVKGDSAARRARSRFRLNNASLLARRVYGRDLPLFDSVHAALGGNIRVTVDSVVAVAAQARNPFEAVRELVQRANGRKSGTADERGRHRRTRT